MMHSTPIPPGYHSVPPGHVANVVTCLEMTARPNLRPVAGDGLSLQRLHSGDTARHRALIAAVGRDLMWFSRLTMADENLAVILRDELVESFALINRSSEIGILELDFREKDQCELSFFGLVPTAIGKGLGLFLMNEALRRAWAKPIIRMWVHTCTFDHPAALPFYQRSGFRPYQFMVEVHPDPRQTGHMARDASAQVPLIEGGGSRHSQR